MIKIVVSGANIFNGGKLEIFRTVLYELSQCPNVEIIAYVNDKKLISYDNDVITFIELPKERKLYVYRFYYEYIFYWKESKRIIPDIWISINDFSPRVIAREQYSYYNNVLPFYKWSFSDLKYCKYEMIIGMVFKYIYGFNVRKVKVIVQQGWIGDKINSFYHVKKEDIIILRPDVRINNHRIESMSSRKKRFIYPVYPRGYKNHEAIVKAVDRLVEEGFDNFTVTFTFEKNENDYGKHIYDICKNNRKLYEFIGMVAHGELERLYLQSDCLLFTSRVESWGLPLTEGAGYGLCIICPDLPYAHETLKEYINVEYVNVNNVDSICKSMKKVIEGNAVGVKYSDDKIFDYNYKRIECWEELINKIAFRN